MRLIEGHGVTFVSMDPLKGHLLLCVTSIIIIIIIIILAGLGVSMSDY